MSVGFVAKESKVIEMEVNCYACGHQMKLVSHEVKIADNGRAYIDSYYKCMFESCPCQKLFGNGVKIKETLHGVENNSDIKIIQL